MLSRTADNLFWMCRYIERAENTARMLSVNLSMSLLPDQEDEQSWSAVLRIYELEQAFQASYPECTAENILHFMVRDPTNPSSIYSCIRASRENARAVRGSLTTEVWETFNSTWLDMLRILNNDQFEQNPERFFEWVKFHSHLVRGVITGTMLEDKARNFMRLGSHLERADNTARLLDVKFHEKENQAPSDLFRSTRHDYYRWSALLAAVSGLEVYRKVYRDVITPSRVAELLILHPDMPRSLLACVRVLSRDLVQVANQRSAETQRLAGRLRAELEYGRIEDVLGGKGLHHYLENFLKRINDLGNRISRDFLVPLTV